MAAKVTIAQRVTSDPDAANLAELVRTQPREATNGALLYDRLQELGVKAVAARAYVKRLNLAALPVMEWPKADRAKLLRGTSVKAIEAVLAVANGRRRERTVSLEEALRACKLARRPSQDGWSFCEGGTVANSYGYRAYQTGFVVAVRSDGSLRVAARECSASKGTSVTNQIAGITARGTADDFRRWADQTLPMRPIIGSNADLPAPTMAEAVS